MGKLHHAAINRSRSYEQRNTQRVKSAEEPLDYCPPTTQAGPAPTLNCCNQLIKPAVSLSSKGFLRVVVVVLEETHQY